jgi:Flp pilus assembly protein TadG
VIARLFRQLRRDQQGVSVVEFALLAPVLLTMLMGLMDLAYNMYTAQMLQGAVQAAARKSTIEGASTNSAAIDGVVTTAVHAVAPSATMTFSRKAYTNFANVNRPEDYDDVNGDAICNNGEPFEDANDNGNWDMDPGQVGFGGARDAVLYQVSITYPRAFPIFAFIPGQTSTFTLDANVVLRNQPYGTQSNAATAPSTGNCT